MAAFGAKAWANRGEIPYYDSTSDRRNRDNYYGDIADNAGSLSPKKLFTTLRDLLSQTLPDLLKTPYPLHELSNYGLVLNQVFAQSQARHPKVKMRPYLS
jgi:hypothetical protein